MKKSLIWMILALIVPFAFVAMAAKSETSTEKGEGSKDWPSPYTITFNTESDGCVTVTLETDFEINTGSQLWDYTDRNGGFLPITPTFDGKKMTAKTEAYETGKEIKVSFMLPVADGQLKTKIFTYTVESNGGGTPVVPPVVDTTWRGNIEGCIWPDNSYLLCEKSGEGNTYTFAINELALANIENRNTIEFSITKPSDKAIEAISVHYPDYNFPEDTPASFVEGKALGAYANGAWRGSISADDIKDYVYVYQKGVDDKNTTGDSALKMAIQYPSDYKTITGFSATAHFNDAGVLQSVDFVLTGESNEPEKATLTWEYTNMRVVSSTSAAYTVNYTLTGENPDGTYIDFFIDNNYITLTVDGNNYTKENPYRLNNPAANGSFEIVIKGLTPNSQNEIWDWVRWKRASNDSEIAVQNKPFTTPMPAEGVSITSNEKGSEGVDFAGNYKITVTPQPDNKLGVSIELEGEYAGLAPVAYFQLRNESNGITGETAIALQGDTNVYAGTVENIANGSDIAFSIKVEYADGGMCVTRTFYYNVGSGEITTVAPVKTTISATFTDWKATSKTGGDLTFSWKWDGAEDVNPTHIELYFETTENLLITANGQGCYKTPDGKQALRIENPAKEGSMVLALDNLLNLGNCHVWPKVRLMNGETILANADQETWLDTSAGATEDDLKRMRVINFSFWHGEFYTDMFKRSGEAKSQEAFLEFVEVGPNGKWYYKYDFSEPITITDTNQLYFSERWTTGGEEYSYGTDNFENTGKEAHIHPYFDARESDKWIKCSGNIDIQGNSRVRTGVKVKTIWVREDPTNLKQGVNQGNFDHLEVYLSSDGSVDQTLTNYQTPQNFDEYYLVVAKGTPIYNLMRGAGAPSDETELRIRFTKHAASEGYYQINLGRKLTLNAQQEFTFVIDPESKDEAEKTDVQFAATATDSFIPSSGAARSTISEGMSFSRIILYAAPKGRSTDMAYTLWLCEPDATGALTYPQGIPGYPDFNPRNLYSLPQLKIWCGDQAENTSGNIGRTPIKDESTGLYTEQHNWNNDANSGFFGPGMAANQKVINASGNTYFVSFRPVIDNDADDKGSAKVSYVTDEYFKADGSYTLPEGYRAVPNLFYIPLPGGITLSKDQAGKGLTPDFNALDFFNLQGENGLTAGVPEAGGQWFYSNAWWCANPNVRYEGDDARYMRFKPGTEGDLVVGEPMTVYGITLFRIVGNRWNMYSNREGDKFDDGNIYYLFFDTKKPEGDAVATGINKNHVSTYIPELSCPILIDRIAGTEITPDEFDDEGNRVSKPDAFQWREIFYYDSRWSEGKPIDFNIPMHNNPEAKKLMYYGLAANGDAQYVCDFPKNGGYRPEADAPFRVIDASGTQIWYENGEVLLPAKYSSYFSGRREHTLFNLLDKNSHLEKFQTMKANGCVGYDINPVTGAATTPIAATASTFATRATAPDPTTGALTLARPDVAYTRLILATNRDNLRVLMKASVPVIEANSNMIFEAPEKEEIGADEQPSPITPYANVKVTVPYNNEDVADGENGANNNKTIDIDLWFNGKTNADGSAKAADFTGKFTVTIDKYDNDGVALSGHATGEIDGRTVTFPVTVLTEDRAGDDVYLNHGERILVFDMPFVIDTQDKASENEEAFTMDNVVADVKIGLGGKNGSNNVQSQINVPEAKVEIKADDPTVSNNVMTNNEFHARLNWSSPNATGNLPKKYIVYSWAEEKLPADLKGKDFSEWTADDIAKGLSDPDGWLKVVYTGTSEKDAYRHTYDAISYNDTKNETGTQALVNMHYGVVLTYNYQVPANGAPVMVSYPTNGSTTPVIDEDAQKLLTGKNVSASDEATLQYDLNKTVTGIDDIEAEEGEVIWYTVDGIRVAEPTRGRIYIRVANGHATSVLF